MDLAIFNRADATSAAALVAPCVKIDSWAAGLVSGRPYPDLTTLLEVAAQQAAEWTDEEVEQALADHPRIGERPTGSGAGAGMSRSEQAGVDPADADLRQRLADGNRRYEERFGRIYLVRAKGRTAEELLDLLEQRLANDPDTERRVTKEQLGEIALLRLKGLFT
jgi:2-oxo-4-hydroxy-4-carboxy-5-ureidoimidazoline decarboxylase